jgi:hypothetical protein
VISLGISLSLGFRIRFRVGIRFRTPHSAHGSVTHIYTLARDTFIYQTHTYGYPGYTGGGGDGG